MLPDGAPTSVVNIPINEVSDDDSSDQEEPTDKEEARARVVAPMPVSRNSPCAICGWDIQSQQEAGAQWVEPIARWAHQACAELWRAGARHKEPARKDWNSQAWGKRCILHVCVQVRDVTHGTSLRG